MTYGCPCNHCEQQRLAIRWIETRAALSDERSVISEKADERLGYFVAGFAFAVICYVAWEFVRIVFFPR
jgi:hypothetical protein